MGAARLANRPSRDGANPAMNSPAPSHLTSAPFKGKPGREQSSSRKDVIPPPGTPHLPGETPSSQALPAGQPLEGGQPWCRALFNVVKHPCLPPPTLVESFTRPHGGQGVDEAHSWQAPGGLFLCMAPAATFPPSPPSFRKFSRYSLTQHHLPPASLFPIKWPFLRFCPAPKRNRGTLTPPRLLKGAFTSCSLILFLEQECVLKIKGRLLRDSELSRDIARKPAVLKSGR